MFLDEEVLGVGMLSVPIYTFETFFFGVRSVSWHIMFGVNMKECRWQSGIFSCCLRDYMYSDFILASHI